MTPTPSLRDRRRIQTARDIQDATLMLAQRHGFDAITTEMIAQAAGISLRSFFNYYTNKEAAFVGPKTGLDAESLRGFAAGTGGLIEDFRALIAEQFRINEPRKEVIQAIDRVIHDNPTLNSAFSRSLDAMTQQLSTALADRADPPRHPDFLAVVLMKSLAHAIIAWGHEPAMSLDQTLDRMGDQLTDAAGCLDRGRG